jgi:hypothetical protein
MREWTLLRLPKTTQITTQAMEGLREAKNFVVGSKS